MNDLNAATLQWLNELAAQGILTTDTELRIRGWNRWLELYSGRRAEDVLGRDLLEVYPELVERRLDQWYRQALNGQVMLLAQRLHHYLLPMPPSESEIGFEYMQQSGRIAPLTSEGRIIGTITVIEDVTERVGREEALRRQIDTLEALHNVSSGILSLDLPECLQRLVDTTATLFHAPLVAVVLRHDDRLQVEASTYDIRSFDDERVNVTNGAIVAVIRSGQPLSIADVAMSKQPIKLLDASSSCTIAAPLIVEGNVIGALAIESPEPNTFSAIDPRQVMLLATQAAIGIRNAQLYHEAQEAIRVRETFLSIASHELKTPLTAMLGYAQVLQRRIARDNSLGERDTRTLNVIATQATRLNRLVASLLDLSRIQTGQLSIERVPLDLCTLAQSVVDDIRQTAEHHTIVLTMPDDPLIVQGDELRLEQVLHNLLQNAVKYSPSGGEVRVHVERRNAQACVLVGDDGIGIPAEALPQLFGRFYRADNVLPLHISGMGVGLYVVKEIIGLHGGEVSVTSQEGAGSIFSFCLPLVGHGLAKD